MRRNRQQKPRPRRSRADVRREARCTTTSMFHAAMKQRPKHGRKPRRFLPRCETAEGIRSRRRAAAVAEWERSLSTMANYESSAGAHMASSSSDGMAHEHLQLCVLDVAVSVAWSRDSIMASIRNALTCWGPQVLWHDNMSTRRRSRRGKVERRFRLDRATVLDGSIVPPRRQR